MARQADLKALGGNPGARIGPLQTISHPPSPLAPLSGVEICAFLPKNSPRAVRCLIFVALAAKAPEQII